jgi:hypothetical protein
MATAHLRGSERLQFGAITHLLAIPLQDLQFGRIDMWATIRCDNQPAQLIALLEAGLMDETITYRRTAAGAAYPLKLVEVEGAVLADSYHAWWSADGLSRSVVKVGPGPVGRRLINPDRDRAAMREWEARVHFRRVDGSTLEALL